MHKTKENLNLFLPVETFSVFVLLLILLGGIILVVMGSNALVNGASDIARRSGLSEFLIGLTIVGIGTSTPEMVVSWVGALQGNSDIAVGNIIGSNIFNVFAILGVTALIMPIAMTGRNLKFDIPVNMAVTFLLVYLGFKGSITGVGDNLIGRAGGIMMVLLFAVYMFICFKEGKADAADGGASSKPKYKNVWIALLIVVAGLAALIGGGRLFVDSACALARHWGLSDKFIAITILACGTSLPELATCVAAAVKKKGQLALGNIIGSNISNILLILGGAAVISPLSFEHIGIIDISAVLISSIMLLIATVTFDRNKIGRKDGIVFLLLFSAYMYFLARTM